MLLLCSFVWKSEIISQRDRGSATHDNTSSSFEARVDYIPALSLAFFLVEEGEWVRSRAHFLILQIYIYSGVS